MDLIVIFIWDLRINNKNFEFKVSVGIDYHQLSVTRYQLLVTSNLLPVTCCQLPVTSNLLPVTCYQWPVTSNLLPVTCYQ